MTTLTEIKRIASELSNSAPRTQMEIVRLCKKLVLGIYDYLDLEALKEILEGLAQYDTRLEACENNKVYRHVIRISDTRDPDDEPDTHIIVIDSTNDTPCTYETIENFLRENVFNYKMYFQGYHSEEIQIFTNGAIYTELDTNYVLRFNQYLIDSEELQALTISDHVYAL